MSKNLVVSNKNLENKIDGLSKFSLEMANAIEQMKNSAQLTNNTVQITSQVVANLKPYIDNSINTVREEIVSVREEISTKILESELKQDERILQQVIKQNDVISQRKKKLKDVYNNCVYRILNTYDDNSDKYKLFHRFVRSWLNEWMYPKFKVSNREGICNDEEKYTKCIEYLGKIRIPLYKEKIYPEWCDRLANSYKYGFEKLKDKNEMIERYERYFGII